MALGLPRPQHGSQRLGGVDHVGHRLPASGAHQIVRVLPFWQQREFQALAGPEPRHRQFDGAIGRAQTGLVAVEAEHRLVRHLPQQRQLVLGQRGAERRHGGGKTGGDHGDDVDIAFDHDHRLAVMGGLARGGDVVERATLMKERRFRRVQVFRLRFLLQSRARRRR